MRHVGGIDTLEWGNDNVDVGVRGYDQAYSSRILVLVDGRQVYADDFGYTPWSAVPIDLGVIRQIEFIKGPSCALFGFNAVGGVINIITYNPLYDTMKTISVTGGTQELAEASAVATHQFGGRVAVRLSGGGRSDSDFSTAIPGFEEDSPREPQNRSAINVDSVIRLNEATLFSIEASHSSVQLNEMGPDYAFTNSQYGTESLKGQLTVESRFGLLQATTYTNWLRDTVNPGFADEPFYFNNRVTVAAVQDIFKLGDDHILRVAAEYRYNTEDSTPTTGASVHYNDYAVSGMWHWKITSRISLTNALSIDHLSLGREGYLPPDYPFTNSDWDHAFTQPSFNSGLVWKPSDADSLRFLASRGVQLPSLNMSGAYLISDPPFLFTGSPLIKPSAVTNYEIGWDHVLAGPHLLFRASAFRQHSDNILSLEGGGSIPVSDGSYFVTSNIGSSDANGMEL